MRSVLKGLNSHNYFFLLFPIFFPKPILFLCNSATIELKDYFNRGAWYNMSGKKMFCVLPQCQNPRSVLGTAPVIISEGSRMTWGAVLSLIVAFWASNLCCKNCSHTLPSGKSRADGSPVPPTCHTERQTNLLFYMCSSGPEFAEMIAYWNESESSSWKEHRGQWDNF